LFRDRQKSRLLLDVEVVPVERGDLLQEVVVEIDEALGREGSPRPREPVADRLCSKEIRDQRIVGAGGCEESREMLGEPSSAVDRTAASRLAVETPGGVGGAVALEKSAAPRAPALDTDEGVAELRRLATQKKELGRPAEIPG
jgi:hypothetical protein